MLVGSGMWREPWRWDTFAVDWNKSSKQGLLKGLDRQQHLGLLEKGVGALLQELYVPSLLLALMNFICHPFAS